MKDKPLRYMFILLCPIFCTSAFADRISLDSSDAPQEYVARAKQLAAQKDYAGVLAMTEEIDQNYKGDHDQEYFASLLCLVRGIEETHFAGSSTDYERIWTIRKIFWKILLTRHTAVEHARRILEMKRGIAKGAGYGAWQKAQGTNEIVVIRQDAVALLKAYADCLHSWIIPNYKRKPELGPQSIAVSRPPPTAEEIAQERAQEEKLNQELARNQQFNNEQYQLNESVRQLGYAAKNLIMFSYCWPPEDDATVNELLDLFPPSEPRERILFDLNLKRKGILKQMKREQAAKSKAKSTATPAQSN